MITMHEIDEWFADIFVALNKEEFLKNGNQNIHFFSSQPYLFPRDLIYIVHEVEKHFHIRFDESDFLDFNFYNLNGIKNMVLKKHTI